MEETGIVNRAIGNSANRALISSIMVSSLTWAIWLLPESSAHQRKVNLADRDAGVISREPLYE